MTSSECGDEFLLDSAFTDDGKESNDVEMGDTDNSLSGECSDTSTKQVTSSGSEGCQQQARTKSYPAEKRSKHPLHSVESNSSSDSNDTDSNASDSNVNDSRGKILKKVKRKSKTNNSSVKLDESSHSDSDSHRDNSGQSPPVNSRRKSKPKSKEVITRLDDSSYSSDATESEEPNSQSQFKKKKFKYKGPTLPLSLLRYMPSSLKEETYGLRTLGVIRPRISALFKEEMLGKVRELVSLGKPDEATALLLELFKRPDWFWRNHFNARGQAHLKSDGSYKVQLASRLEGLEDMGVMVLDMLEYLVEDRRLLMDIVLEVAKGSNKWRLRKFNKLTKHKKSIPKTICRCAEIFLLQGDVEKFAETFEDFCRNLENVKGERRLTVFRCVAAMLDRKLHEDSDVSMSGTSFTSFTSKHSRQGANATIDEMKASILENAEEDIEWVIRLFAWYLMDQRCADDVLELLIQFRDNNCDHLPAHKPLLEFLEQEYSEETELRLQHLLIAAEKFPWDSCVVNYCKLRAELEEDDEERFQSDGEEILDDGRRKPVTQDTEVDTAKRLITFLDYDFNCGESLAWKQLAVSLRKLGTGKVSVAGLWEGRGTWWWLHNYRDLEEEDTDLLVRKATVAVFLAGNHSLYFHMILLILKKRNQLLESAYLDAVVAELCGWRDKIDKPCILPRVVESSTKTYSRLISKEMLALKELRKASERIVPKKIQVGQKKLLKRSVEAKKLLKRRKPSSFGVPHRISKYQMKDYGLEYRERLKRKQEEIKAKHKSIKSEEQSCIDKELSTRCTRTRCTKTRCRRHGKCKSGSELQPSIDEEPSDDEQLKSGSKVLSSIEGLPSGNEMIESGSEGHPNIDMEPSDNEMCKSGSDSL